MFAKLDNGDLLIGDSVMTPDAVLVIETKDDYTYPVEGWYWFSNEHEARQFFNLPELPAIDISPI
jgi:hypothetical protein